MLEIFAINENWDVLEKFKTFKDADAWAKTNKFFQILYRNSTKLVQGPVRIYRNGASGEN